MSSKKGVKHNIQCLCVLPQFRNRVSPPSHEFVVFSILDASDVIEEKYSQCNNCGVIHKIVDLCKSEIATNRAEISLLTEKDISLMLPRAVCDVLENYNCDLPTWEHALFIVNEEKWEEFIVLEKNTIDDGFEGKLLRFKPDNRYTIEPFIDRRAL
ncbi:MAG: hypothetical protein ACR2PE_00460 [Porticoccus sp.]